MLLIRSQVSTALEGKTVDHHVKQIRSKSARQQPEWHEHPNLREVLTELSAKPALVHAEDVETLRSLLARVAAGELHVVQTGDCAEDPAECASGYIARKSALVDLLAAVMKMASNKPVLRVGRIAGQFGKPRSQPTEVVGGVELPVYRGHLVNSPEPDPALRRPDPFRLLSGYEAASEAMHQLGWRRNGWRRQVERPLWTSHEALVLDYDLSLLRRDEEGRPLLTSTHWPWVGERTRQVDGAHVALLTEIVNPVACKVGPTATPEELLALCERLDPDRSPGRLTLIARMGAELVGDRLPPLVAAVRAEGHPVSWLCDPMHGNTVTTEDGSKTRFVETVIREVEEFQWAVAAGGGIAGGLHLETTPDDVTECVSNHSPGGMPGDKYTSFCDPRLNLSQAVAVASAWRG
jgi:3-deoxy-7-phosphoheptulonate synthase